MCDEEPETPTNNHMLEPNASESSECGSDAESTSSSRKSNTTSEPSVQCDPSKGNVAFSSTSNEKETDSTSCEYCSVMEKENEECTRRIAELEEKCAKFEQFHHELSGKLELALHQKELAVKEKEAMVIRYAVGEKNTLEQKHLKEQAEKKYKDAVRESEILQHKLSRETSEKNRIAQMLDNKCYELKSSQQELDRLKADLGALETKLKWSQNSLKTEIEQHKDCQLKVETLSGRLQEITEQIDKTKRDADESIKSFHHSQENKAFVLEQQLKELQASLILLRHERDDREQQVKSLQIDLERVQSKQKETLQENNRLSVKVQQLEHERVETEQKLSELRGCADLQRQEAADLAAKTAQLEQLKLQLQNEQEQLQASNEQIDLLKRRNLELEMDMEACRIREKELLVFTQQLTDKNVRLQSEFTALETKVQQLTCEQTLLKRSLKEKETKIALISSQSTEEKSKLSAELEVLNKNLCEKVKYCDKLNQELADQKGENVVIKRRMEQSLREVTKELQQCRKKLQHYESGEGNVSSSASESASERSNGASPPPTTEKVKVIQPDNILDRQTLIEHIVKLQRISARKSEKLDFLEEHVKSLVAELQKKSQLLQTYILREQAGALSSNAMDKNKANLAKQTGVMASMYSSRVADNNLTLELSMDINRKLQAVLEDALLKNITLKGNVDTLANEIERLNKLLETKSESGASL